MADKCREASQINAVVFGGYVNGYGIIRSLHDAGVREISLVDDGSSASRWSRLVRRRYAWDGTAEGFVRLAHEVHADQGYFVPFPTDDKHVELLASNSESLRTICFLPVNESTTTSILDKSVQYAAARRAGIAVPKSSVWSNIVDLDSTSLRFPVLVKPVVRGESSSSSFRNIVLNSVHDLAQHRHRIELGLRSGGTYLASELIPGSDVNVYAYTAYRNRDGHILREWCGRKLAQHPDDFGVYSSASNQTTPGLVEQGRALVDELDAFGIVEPEFKLDPRDGQLKLMEVNLRSMMWHRVGALAGVNLPEAQILDAVGIQVPICRDQGSPVRHVYFGHEFSNLIARPKYLSRFRANLFGPGKREWAFWNYQDPGPFVYSLLSFGKLVIRACQRRLA